MPGSGPESGKVRVERDGAVAFVVLDNEARRNALTAAMLKQVREALAALDADPEVRVIVLRGAGDRAFASGADLEELGGRIGPPAGRDPGLRVHKPLVAMIHGACIGGGLLLALLADLRVAADDATFAIPAARLGVGYPYEGVRRLVEVCGPAGAAEILLCGERFGAQDAQRLGLVNRVVPKAELEAAVRELAEGVAAGAPLTLRAAKAAIQAVLEGSRPDRVAACEELIAACWQSEDFAEGRRALAERRPPRFVGR
jgi:enoyl-CoA hydratase